MSEPQSDVYVVESGDYEQRGIDLVAESVKAAVEAIKAVYGPPYTVHWGEACETHDGLWSLAGHFVAVPGHATEHTAYYEITRYEVATAADSMAASSEPQRPETVNPHD